MAKSSGQLVGVMILSVMILAGTGLFGIWYSQERADAALQRLGALARLIDSSRQVQVEFKIQVQLWKNLLLRGQDQGAFQSYWKKFQDQHQLVEKKLQETAESPALPPELKPEVLSLQAEHASLWPRYEKAAALYVSGDPPSLFRVDEAVRGIDQALNAGIDDLAGRLAKVETATMAEVRREGEERYDQLCLTALIAAGFAIGSAGLVVWQSLRRKS